MIRTTWENGGGTFDPRTLSLVSVDSGYLVGILQHGRKFAEDDFTPENVGAWIYHTSPAFHDPDTFIGTWVDGDTVHVDVVRHFTDRDAAIREGIRENQVAVWDCANVCEIPTGGTGSV